MNKNKAKESGFEPKPFEIAITAVALSALRSWKDPLMASPSGCLSEARNLIIEAATLKDNQKLPVEYPSSSHSLANLFGFKDQIFTFDELLTPRREPAPGRKKPQTVIGSITTVQGLMKAVRRCFPPETAKRINRDKRMLEAEARELNLKTHSARSAGWQKRRNRRQAKS